MIQGISGSMCILKKSFFRSTYDTQPETIYVFPCPCFQEQPISVTTGAIFRTFFSNRSILLQLFSTLGLAYIRNHKRWEVRKLGSLFCYLEHHEVTVSNTWVTYRHIFSLFFDVIISVQAPISVRSLGGKIMFCRSLHLIGCTDFEGASAITG
jgi:hypothetical protein